MRPKSESSYPSHKVIVGEEQFLTASDLTYVQFSGQSNLYANPIMPKKYTTATRINSCFIILLECWTRLLIPLNVRARQGRGLIYKVDWK
ncbi:unnamed protein product [Macrosiphum euphorbiae]|uniref:Uncharacterized protein n=1 Tax=Macrosiphum euphorbiae TaxID=13131 RepID=A0AAV0XLX3_9HEMI|nr:unnamed protein product [Macrosiphum euphorbiae]